MMAKRQDTTRESRCRRRAFTMIELVTSMAIATVLLVAIGSAMMLAARALPSGDGPATATLQAAGLADRIADELQYAIHIPERTSRSLTFTIPDRDGDGKNETIRYAWSGTANDPLTRQYNGNAPVTLAAIRSLNFTCNTQAVTEEFPGPVVEGAEVLLSSHYPATGTYTSNEHYLNPGSGAGQFIEPSLPADAYKYRVTRVVFRARKNNPLLPTGTVGVALYKTNAKLPTGGALASTTITELLLPNSMGDVEVPLSAALAADEDFCLIIDNALNLLTAGRVEYCSGSGSGMLVASSGTYSHNSSNSLRYRVFGRISTVTKRTLTRTLITSVNLTLQTTGDEAGRIDTAIALSNKPEALAAHWEAQFNENPTTADRNLDGQPDWRSGTGFDMGAISGGVWRADRTLDSNPVNSFTQFTTVDVALRDATNGGGGAGVEMRVEATLLGHGIIEAYIARQSNGTQTLTVQTRDLLLLPSVLLTVPRLPPEMVQLRLYVDPSNDSVAVVANGVFHGAYSYNRSVDLADGVVRIFNTLFESGAEFDSIRIRVGQ